MRQARSRATGCAVAGLLLLATFERALAQTLVDLELVLAVDASGSVDAAEFQLQTRGLARAFRDPAVHAALEATGGRGIAVSLVQWSGRRQQVVVVDWTLLPDAREARAFAGRIEDAGRWILGETALADAIGFATGLLDDNRFEGFRRVIDVSGDGPSNTGHAPTQARDRAVAAGITINGLAITNEIRDLDAYYREQVIGGPGAFLMAARNYDDFARAMREKLIKEIRGTPLSGPAPEGAPAAERQASAIGPRPRRRRAVQAPAAHGRRDLRQAELGR